MKKNNTLPQLLDAVMNHPQLPEPIYKAISKSLTALYREHVNSDTAFEHKTGVEYLDKLFRMYRKQVGASAVRDDRRRASNYLGKIIDK